jgi:hypothetical protein
MVGNDMERSPLPTSLIVVWTEIHNRTIRLQSPSTIRCCFNDDRKLWTNY